MDELWQRYRAFWTPVLIGVGVFLVGLIVVHAFSEDPKSKADEVNSKAKSLRRKWEPRQTKIENVGKNADLLGERMRGWAVRLDQAHLGEATGYAVSASLRAALLRGLTVDGLKAAIADIEKAKDAASAADDASRQDREEDLAEARLVLAAFDGDEIAAGRALTRFETVRLDRLELLRTGDPNVGFFRLLADIRSEMKVRANRADVDLKVESMGFAGVSSVTRATLPERLLNLALVSRIVDLAIRSGARAVDDIRIGAQSDVDSQDLFYREYPVTITMTGDMAAMQPLIDMLTDTASPVPVKQALLAHPRRGTALEGLVQFQVTAVSAVVNPDAELALDTEEQP